MSFTKKYEPKTVQDIIVENPRTKQRLQDYADGRRTKHVLLHGPRGTGKSSAARVISEARTGGDLEAFTQAYEGATFKEADFKKIINDWNWQLMQGVKVPVTVINEVDQLDSAMREKLKAFMDDHGHLGQIIGTTNNQHMLTAAQRDRFDMIEMPALSSDAFAPRMREILSGEGADIPDQVIRNLLDSMNGSLRDGLSIAEDAVLETQRKSAA